MPEFSFILLHVADHDASAAFYSQAFGLPIVERKDDFAMLPLREGVMLGLWNRATVEPAGTGQSGASEIAFTLPDAAAVEAAHAAWKGRGLTILQPPTAMVFGTTFLALDLDGHRLRLFAPPAA